MEQYRYPVKGRFLEFPQGTWEEKADAPPEAVEEFEALVLEGRVKDASSVSAYGLLRLKKRLP